MRVAARSYIVSSEALGRPGATPVERRDRFSLGYQVALAAEAIRDLAKLLTPAIMIGVALLSGCSIRPQARLLRGVTRADRGDYHGAIADYDLVLRQQPANAEAAYLRGAAHDRLGDRAAAIADYDLALRLKADLLPAYVARAAAHAALNDSVAAAADYEAVRRLMIDDQVH